MVVEHLQGKFEPPNLESQRLLLCRLGQSLMQKLLYLCLRGSDYAVSPFLPIIEVVHQGHSNRLNTVWRHQQLLLVPRQSTWHLYRKSRRGPPVISIKHPSHRKMVYLSDGIRTQSSSRFRTHWCTRENKRCINNLQTSFRMRVLVCDSICQTTLLNTLHVPDYWQSSTQSTRPKYITCVSRQWGINHFNEVVYKLVGKTVWKPKVPTVNGQIVALHWATICQISTGGRKTATNEEWRKAGMIDATATWKKPQKSTKHPPLPIQGQTTETRRHIIWQHKNSTSVIVRNSRTAMGHTVATPGHSSTTRFVR